MAKKALVNLLCHKVPVHPAPVHPTLVFRSLQGGLLCLLGSQKPEKILKRNLIILYWRT